MNAARAIQIHSESLYVKSAEPLEFIDITSFVEAAVHNVRLEAGMVNVQTRHTTTGVVVNENEPLLLLDLRDRLERFAPRDARYQHDRFDIRTENMNPGERANGHSHTGALVLRASECLNVLGGALQLGRWQRVFLVDLDGPREREVSLLLMGAGETCGQE